MNQDSYCQDLGLKWDQRFRLLGVDFDADLMDYTPNISSKIKEMQRVMDDWKHRFLSPLGRCTVAKTLLLSKVNHLAFVIPNMKLSILDKIEKLIYEFIWAGKPSVAREDTKQDWNKGGMETPDIRKSWKAFKLSWLRRRQRVPGWKY